MVGRSFLSEHLRQPLFPFSSTQPPYFYDMFSVEGQFLLHIESWDRGREMYTHCPHCQSAVVQPRNREGPNFCPHCRQLFELPEEERKMPPWILGVLVFLTANWQLMVQQQ
jgi:hypothetical protein